MTMLCERVYIFIIYFFIALPLFHLGYCHQRNINVLRERREVSYLKSRRTRWVHNVHHVQSSVIRGTVHRVRAGESVTFSCSEHDIENSLFAWRISKERSSLNEGDLNGRVAMERNNASLTITQVSLGDAGEYLCHSHNGLGRITRSFTLEVTGRGTFVKIDVNSESYVAKCVTTARRQSYDCTTPRRLRRIRGYWIHQYQSKNCVHRYFRDCDAIINKYATKSECENTCFETCRLPAKQGPCSQYTPRLYFNRHTGICEPFTFGGCHGNPNNFEDIQACENICSSNSNRVEMNSITCPMCPSNIGRGFCSADFVVVGIVKAMSSTVPGTIQIHLTRIFKDHLGHLNNSLISTSNQRIFSLRVNENCPCPDFKTMLFGSSFRSNSNNNRPVYCSDSEIRNSRSRRARQGRCQELIMTGKIVNGIPTITQGREIMPAIPINILRMEGMSRSPEICRTLERLMRRERS